MSCDARHNNSYEVIHVIHDCVTMLMHDMKHRIAEVLENQQPMLTPEWEAHINITLCHSMTDLKDLGHLDQFDVAKHPVYVNFV